MAVQGVAFDLEGTIVDVEPAHHHGHFAAAAAVGVEINMENAFKLLPHFIGGPDSAIVQEIYDLSNKRQPLEYIAERDRSHYLRLLSEMKIAPRPRFLEFLENIRGRGIKTCIVTATVRQDAWVLIQSARLDKSFPEGTILYGESVANPKPAADIYLESAKLMDIASIEQIAFEDSARGIKSAVAAGSTAYGIPVYNRSETINPLLEAGAKKVFLGWDEININEIIG